MIEPDIKKLKRFIYEAKRNTFAANNDKIKLTDGANCFFYQGSAEFAEFEYCDQYFGNIIDCGQETVTIESVPIWKNQYYGGTVQNIRPHGFGNLSIDDWSHVIRSFLKCALMKMSIDFPVRGPKVFNSMEVCFKDISIRGKWQYLNSWESRPLFAVSDDIVAYSGLEKIFLDDSLVFWHIYHGGLIYDKAFPLLVKEGKI